MIRFMETLTHVALKYCIKAYNNQENEHFHSAKIVLHMFHIQFPTVYVYI